MKSSLDAKVRNVGDASSESPQILLALVAATGWSPLPSLGLRHGPLMVAPNHGLAAAFFRSTRRQGFLQNVESSDGPEDALCNSESFWPLPSATKSIALDVNTS
jgi:hypothetical protein